MNLWPHEAIPLTSGLEGRGVIYDYIADTSKQSNKKHTQLEILQRQNKD